MIACCCGPLFWRFNYSTSIMNILLRKTTSNNSIFTNGESWVNIRMVGLIFLSSFWVIRKCVCHTKYGFLWQKILNDPTISMNSYTYFADFYIFAQSFIIKSSTWKKIIYIVSILFVAIVITTIAYALFDFNHENLIIIFFSSLISIIITEYVRKRISWLTLIG